MLGIENAGEIGWNGNVDKWPPGSMLVRKTMTPEHTGTNSGLKRGYPSTSVCDMIFVNPRNHSLASLRPCERVVLRMMDESETCSPGPDSRGKERQTSTVVGIHSSYICKSMLQCGAKNNGTLGETTDDSDLYIYSTVYTRYTSHSYKTASLKTQYPRTI